MDADHNIQVAYKVWCQYEFSGNVAPNIGVYSTRERAIDAVNSVTKPQGVSFEELRIQGLADIKEMFI